MTKSTAAPRVRRSKLREETGPIHRDLWASRQRTHARLEDAMLKADADYYGPEWAKIVAEFLRESGPQRANWSKAFGPRPVEYDEDHWRMAIQMIGLISADQCEKAAAIIESLRSTNYRMWADIRHCVWIFMGHVLDRFRDSLKDMARTESVSELPMNEWHPFYRDMRGNGIRM